MVAAGRGRRMGGRPKQFRPLDGRPALCWSARTLCRTLAGPVAVVVREQRLEEAREAIEACVPGVGDRIRLVVGGARRRDSVAAGLEAVSGAGAVLVHDAARPFASEALVGRVARRAAEGRAVIPVLPIRDTLKEIEGDRVVRTVDRDRFAVAQTPQGFPLELLRRAHEATDEDATDDAELCERAGVPVGWIEGEPLNRKLTDPEDWEWAEAAIASGRVRWR